VALIRVKHGLSAPRFERPRHSGLSFSFLKISSDFRCENLFNLSKRELACIMLPNMGA